MRIKFFPIFSLLIILANGLVFSQPLPEQDCIAAIPVCQDTFVQNTPYVGIGSATAGQGPGGNEINGQISCMSAGERNDVWYTFTVQTSGNLCFNIEPVDVTDDYDWAVFNLTNSPCDSIFTDSTLEVSCNYSSVPGTTGANGLPGTQNQPCIAVNAGETYVLNVSQFTTSPNGYTLNFSASTAQLYDNIPPVMDSVSGPVSCGDTQIYVYFSENVLCATVQPSDFTLTGPSGNITVSSVTSAGCGSGSTYDDQYILTVSPAISPNGIFSLTLLANAAVEDLCNNPNTGANAYDFTASPYTTQVSTTPQLCSSNNGTATAAPTGGFSPYTYSWNTSPPQSTATATGLIPGVYTVTVTDAVGCISNGSGSVGFDPGTNPPIASISSFTNATCSGMNDGTASVSASGGTSPYAYIWSNGQTGSTATGLGTGTVICTVTDNNGCYDTATVVISGGVPIIIRAIPSDTTICNGGTASLSAMVISGGTNPFTYTWLKNGFFDGNNIPHPVSPVVTTVYSVFATDNSGCLSDTADVTVTVLPPISVNVTAEPDNMICPGDSVKLKASGYGGKGSGYSYVWDNTTSTGSEIYVKPSSNTTYTVTVTDGCTSTPAIESIVITVGQPPPTMKIFADPLEGCVPLRVQFHIEPFIQGYIYKWDFGDGNLRNDTSNTVYNTYLKEGFKDVSLVIITNQNCSDTIIEDSLINPFPSPIAEFIFSPTAPGTLHPIVTFYERCIGANSWQWDLGDNAISNNQVVQHEYADSGNYVVRLVASNDYQCTDTVIHTVVVDYEATFYLPNSFSPNEDELNDVFGPAGEGFTGDGFVMFIFDRWGNIVYKTENINQPWDGKVSGNYVKDGVYVYYMKFKTLKGDEKKIRGTVTLLK